MSPSPLPRYLYKYRTFDTKTLRLIASAEIYYASANSFNDPLDSSPGIEIDTDMPALEKLLYSMISELHCKDRALREIENHKYLASEDGDYRTNPSSAEYYKRLLASNISDILMGEFSKCGILSLAEHWDCPLMWSHYGDQHRGICLEYDMKNNLCDGIEPINYKSSRIIKISEIFDWKVNGAANAKDVIFKRVFFGKAPQWDYEHEWRTVVAKSGATSAPANINAIYLGCRCDDVVLATLVKLYIGTEGSIKFYRVYPKNNGFQLGRFKIDRDEYISSIPRSPAVLDFVDDLVNKGFTRPPFWLK